MEETPGADPEHVYKSEGWTWALEKTWFFLSLVGEALRDSVGVWAPVWGP